MTVPRRLLLLSALGLALFSQNLRAQEASPPVEMPDAGTDQSGDATSSGPNSGNLFPENGATATGQPGQPILHGRPRASRLLGTKNKRNARPGDLLSSEADADPLDVRIAFRRAKTQAMVQDPGLADLLHNAAMAPNDKAKRDWLRQYYTRLYAEVRKIDPSPTLASHVTLLALIARQRYDPQRRMLAGEEDLVNGRRRH
jgi:hypothetical protein